MSYIEQKDLIIVKDTESYPRLTWQSVIDSVENTQDQYVLLTSDADIVTIKHDKYWLNTQPAAGDEIFVDNIVLWNTPFHYHIKINEQVVYNNSPDYLAARKYKDEIWYTANKKQYDQEYEALPDIFKKAPVFNVKEKYELAMKEFPIFKAAILLADKTKNAGDLFKPGFASKTAREMGQSPLNQNMDEAYKTINLAYAYKQSAQKNKI